MKTKKPLTAAPVMPADSVAEEPVELPIEDWIDLHAFAPKDIPAVVDEYLNECYLRGWRNVRIIHGRGIGVQREIVRSVLARTPFVLSYADAPAEAGGWGATLVTLDRQRSPDRQ